MNLDSVTIFHKLQVELKDEGHFDTELQKVYGIGKTNNLYKKYGFNRYASFGVIYLKPNFEYHIEINILKNYLVSFPLKQNIKDNINKKIVKKIYQGLRHKLGLSVHGQRTHSNCKTFRHFFKKSLNLLNTPKSNKKQVKKNMLKKKEEKQKKKELDKKKSKKKK